jgi:hypothetical protein
MRVALATVLLAVFLAGCFKDAGKPPTAGSELEGDLDRPAADRTENTGARCASST